MNFIDLAGGLGSGVAAGMQDVQQQQLTKARLGLMRQQQQAAAYANAEAARQDQMRRELAQAPQAGSHVEDTSQPGISSQDAAESGGTLAQSTPTKTVGQGDALRGQAAIISKYDPVKGAQLYELARNQDIQQQMDALRSDYATHAAAIKADPGQWADTHGITAFNNSNTAGHFATSTAAPDGGRVFMLHDNTGIPVAAHYVSPDDLSQFALDNLNRQYISKLALVAPPEQFPKYYQAGLQGVETNAKVGLYKSEASKNQAIVDSGNFGEEGRNAATAAVDQARVHTGNFGEQERNHAWANEANQRATEIGVPRPTTRTVLAKIGGQSMPLTIQSGGKDNTIKVFDPTGKQITDPQTLRAVFGQDSGQDPYDAEMLDAAAKTGDPTQLAQARAAVATNQAQRAVLKARTDFSALPDDNARAAKYQELQSSPGMTPAALNVITGGWKPKGVTRGASRGSTAASQPSGLQKLGVNRRAAARDQAATSRVAARQKNAADAQAAYSQAIQSGDAGAAMRVQAMPGFDDLPQQYKQNILDMVNGQ